MHFCNTHSHFHNFLVLVAGTTLLHLFVLTCIYFISTANFIELRSTITKVILIPVVRGKSYSLSLCSLLLLVFITKHYSTYTLFTAFVSKTVFFSYKLLIKSELSRKYTKEETKNVGRRGRQRDHCVHPKGPFVVLERSFNSIC